MNSNETTSNAGSGQRDAPEATRLSLWLFASAAAAGAASAWYEPLSVFAILILVVALAATTRLNHPKKSLIVFGLFVSMGLALVGLTRFALGDALQGIIEARGRASSTRAVSTLREILFAQDAMRRYAFIDPDADSIGSAGLLAELSGASSARGKAPLATPPLAPRFAPAQATRTGPALERDGYLFLICLPKAGGGLTAQPGEGIDDELAERRWVAYAWPAASASPHQLAYFINEHERILESENGEPDALRLVGPSAAPECDDVERSPRQWTAWRDKQPRPELPGDQK